MTDLAISGAAASKPPAAISGRRFVRMFMPTFASRVRTGEKAQTVRPTPKRMPRTGDIFDGREWTGRPYASKQRKLIEAPILKVSGIYVERGCIVIDDYAIGAAKALAFARADGFDSAEHFYEWFDKHAGLPFTGIVIYWTPPLGGGGAEPDGESIAINRETTAAADQPRCGAIAPGAPSARAGSPASGGS